jgi:hypothetical protein
MVKNIDFISSQTGFIELGVSFSSTNIQSLMGLSHRDIILVENKLVFYLMSLRDIIIF